MYVRAYGVDVCSCGGDDVCMCMGRVGEWSDVNIRALVLPVAGGMDENELGMDEGCRMR